MSKRNQHIVPHENGWAVRGAGAQRATSVHTTQQQAIDAGRSISQIKAQNFLFTDAMVKSAPETHMAMILTHPKVNSRQDEVCASCK